MTERLSDEVIDHVVRGLPRTADPDRSKILELNKELRKEAKGGLGGGIGYLALRIPVPDMRVLQLRYPDLASLDPEIQHKAWKKFIASPESEPYKVWAGDGKRKVAR